jgi:hypothetical protein
MTLSPYLTGWGIFFLEATRTIAIKLLTASGIVG